MLLSVEGKSLLTYMKKVYDWMARQVYSPYAGYMLGIMFYFEAILFLPTDPILVLYCIQRPNRAMRYATIATIGSVLGGITSYALGYYLWSTVGDAIIHESFINRFVKPETFLYMCDRYRTHEGLAILIAGMIPIVPFKAVTLTAGFCRLSFLPFVFYSCIVRGFRFFLVAGLIKIWGAQMKEFIDRYFGVLVALVLLVVGVIVWIIRSLSIQ
jgi:membrane protein YqaA with SNARE-associated domain